ncbi:MAG TPA: DUF3558 domain-containing protein [Actinophytocola sp.]|uniref:DUF3558 domain-containing protein n=1 Tax=Actinophytocola sp. TaxID=1872138 RepID=UPI002DB9E405|nr:DUF3558 domain-containing protein [Actinophytocola sp.]HEU5474040.1 DUF3558 domain-containing protein [Actinophytocola sp.]
MRDRRLRLVLTGLLTAAAVAGCTTGEIGQAVPTPSSTPQTSGGTSSPAPSARVSVPPRPAELNLAGVDPCALITDPTLAALKLNRKRVQQAGDSQYRGMAQCTIDSTRSPFDSYALIAVTNEGVEAWLTGKRNVQAQLSSVAGFPAVTYWLSGANGRNAADCSTSVDVAGGQQLMVESYNTGDRIYTLEQLCQRAERAAGMAVETLKTLR